MVTFVDTNGTEHQINGSESIRKAMKQSAGHSVIITDEAGQLVSAGNNMHQLEANGQIVKALRAGGTADADDKKIQQAAKHHDKMPKVKKVLLINKSFINTLKKPEKNTKPFAKSHSTILAALGELQAYKTSIGLI